LKLAGKPSIRRTLTQQLLLTATISMAIAILGFGINDWLTLRAYTLDHLNAQASVVGTNSSASLMMGDSVSARLTLESLRNDRQIVAAALYNSSYVPLASFSPYDLSLPDIQTAGYEGSLDHYLYVAQEVRLNNESIGKILIVADFNYLSQRQVALVITGVGLLLLTLLVIFVLSPYLQKVITDPILKLAATARKVSQDEDYSQRAEKLSGDEIGWLVDDFNEMLNQIQFRDHMLQRSQARLEEKMAERTQELTELSNRLEQHAYYDTLTGLANRLTFDDHLKLAIHQVERYGGEATVMILDLDRFKIINDTLGHVLGDKLLVQVADRLRTCVSNTDTLARLGGDEFAVLLFNPKAAGKAEDSARHLIDSVSQAFNIDGYNLHITVSIGISVYPVDGADAETIIKNADTAMYRSKEQGKNVFTFFAPEMNARALRRLELESRLRRVIRDRKLQVFYQPRRDANSLKILGAEALTRWVDPELGEITPSEFIPLAEECGFSALIDDWVLKNACGDMTKWFGDQHPSIGVSVNFSATQFLRKDLPLLVAETLEETGFPGSCLELEITENLFGPDTADPSEPLEKIRDMGVEIAIDDFGKAYSSLSRLKQLPLQTLKIDQEFIRDLEHSRDDQAMVRTIISMAKGMELTVVAEGIETPGQHAFVRDHGCDVVQGYLFGRPLNATEFKQLLIAEGILPPA